MKKIARRSSKAGLVINSWKVRYIVAEDRFRSLKKISDLLCGGVLDFRWSPGDTEVVSAALGEQG
ncbi:hypothetical protein MA16_Dca013942 [Dendrobium catenatum]|uniref:Uncharacterized protein n=1 Tax=Dendrobium catenatum TaxID=906689 RepID=A0A2I0XGG2_9ASPA|nr:hypothetical protein MA16_Dca013942 [Dendrobium catenatum]